MELTSENVYRVLGDCLFKEGEDTTNHVLTEGVMLKFGLHPERLKSHEQDIIDMLSQLPKEFKKGSGDGYSFLNACVTSDGVQWGEQKNVDELLCLGVAIGKAKILLSREEWVLFPGGVPYFSVEV